MGGNDNSNSTNVIDYITIATTGNATDFGDTTGNTERNACCSNGERGVSGGGNYGSSKINLIQYVTIATTGNATDFGDLTQTRSGPGSCSGE